MKSMSRCTRASHRPRRRGQALVEFGLVLPLLVMLFLGIVEMGLILNDYLSQVQANGDAAKFGSRLFCNGNANELIVDRFLENRGQLSPGYLDFYGASGAKLGSFTKTGSAIVTLDGAAASFAMDTFYMNDNGTPDNLADDYPTSCMDLRASYVKLKTVYRHQMIVPGVSLITPDNEFPLSVENVYPVSPLDIGGAGGAPFDPTNLQGGFPISVMDREWVVGQEYVLKGKARDEPDNPGTAGFGNFGWVNLDKELGGNKNQNIANWIRGINCPPVSIPGYIPGYTGQRNASDIRSALDEHKNKLIFILIHDGFRGTGNNLEYNVIGIGVFRCEDFTENTDGNGQPHLEVSGQFVRRLF